MTLLLLHMKLEICTQHVFDQYLATVYQLPDFACYSYWYMMIVLDAYCMLRWLVHGYYTKNARLPVMVSA